MADMVPVRRKTRSSVRRSSPVGCSPGWTTSKMDLVIGAMRSRRFRRGEVIFHGGDPGDSLFIVSSGSVKIMVDPEDGSEPAILTTVGAGGFFGELALLDGRARSATAVAVDRVETLVLRRDAFDRLIDEEPAISRALLAALAGGDPAPDGPIRGPPFPGPAGSARATPAPPDRAGRSAGPVGEVRQPWPYTQGELAGMIGGSRQSVNRLLADFVGRVCCGSRAITWSSPIRAALRRPRTDERGRVGTGAHASASWRLMRSSRWRPGCARLTGSCRPPASRHCTPWPRRRRRHRGHGGVGRAARRRHRSARLPRRRRARGTAR